jgi:transposase
MQIYGIDVSSGHLDLYSLDQENKTFVKRISNKLSAIMKFMTSISKDSVLCAEHTGVYGNLLVGMASSCGIRIALIEGYVIHKSFAIEKGKSDQIDARRIWEYGTRFYDKLRFVEPVCEVLHELKELQNLRNQFVKQRKMLLTSEKGKKKQLMNSITCGKLQEEATVMLTRQIKEIEKEMRLLIKQNPDFERNYVLAKSVTGIGDVIATELIVYTENFTKINEAKKAASFAGVCPFPNESGSISKRPKVPKRSNKKLKSLLFMAALNISNFNKEMKLYRERKTAEGKHFFLVMNNIANKLLRIIFAVIRTGKPYDPMYICIDPRKI